MAPFEFVITQLVLVLGLYLIAFGWAGIITGTAFIHLIPFGLQRPAIYALVAYLIFLDPLEATLGKEITHALFFIAVAAIIYEAIRTFLVSSVKITGASPETVDADLRHAFTTLGLRYAGNFPNYKLRDPWAQLRVKYWKSLGEAQITIYPKAQRPLLAKIEALLDKDFSSQEQTKVARGFVINLVEGAVLIGIAAWKIGTS